MIFVRVVYVNDFSPFFIEFYVVFLGDFEVPSDVFLRSEARFGD